LAETTTTEESYTISKIKAPPLSPQLPISTPLKIKEIQLNKDLHEEGSEDVLVELKKTEGQQWGMGIGKRARGILITSLQPGSTAAEKLKVGDKICAVNDEKIVDQVCLQQNISNRHM
jgi:C-terminal processing protease CtpA/Prc